MRSLRYVTIQLAVAAAFAGIAAAQTAATLLVDTAWLADHINDRNLVVLHVEDQQDYTAGHIPGARLITMQDIARQNNGLILELPTAEDLRARLEKFGISDDSRIVVYYGRNGGLPSTTRIILTLDHMGLGDRTSLLNGGLVAWTKAGKKVTTDVPAVAPGKLSTRPVKPVVTDAEFVKTLPRAAHTLVDGRAAVFYTGIQPSMGRNGHIPGAVNIPFTEIADSELMIDRARLEKLYRTAGVKPGDTVVVYCHIGQQGTAIVFGARLLGHQAVLYDGSMQDWANNNRGSVEK
jgi:thiosulfate/3-mercaptopyruvate sulfurtransferase